MLFDKFFRSKVWGCLALLLVTSSAIAHHSRAEFPDESQEITGEIVGIDWRSPHPSLTLQIEGSSGPNSIWDIEAYGSLYTLTRAGISPELFSFGEQVRLYGFRSTRTERRLLVTNMLRADEVEIVFDRAGSPKWNTVAIGGQENYVLSEDDFVDAKTENQGLFRLWSRTNPANVGGDRHEAPTLTAEGLTLRSELSELPFVWCPSKGMPWMMSSPQPYEIIEDGELIKILGHEGTNQRTIYMNLLGDPSENAPSMFGVSVGHWEGDTLVVETTGISATQYRRQVPLSEAAKVVERFTLSEDQKRLHYYSETTDPSLFSSVGILERNFAALGEEVMPFECVEG